MDGDTISRDHSDAVPDPRVPSRAAPSDRDAKKTRSSWPNEVEQLLPQYMARIKQWPVLTGKDLNDNNSMALLKTIRQQMEDIMLLDIEYPVQKNIDETLWTHVHYKVIDEYRKRIVAHEKQYNATRPVEYRKLVDNYTRFLKETTNFYRVLIQRLVSHYNVVDLQPIVKQFKLQVDIPPEAPKFPSKKIKSFVFTAVQTSLIKLGDISRYRALTPSRTKTPSKPDYGPAYGYYVLAQSLLPDNGAPANQLGVLSTYSKDFLASTYYFYRALACDEPFTTAGNNLGLGFRKILRDGVGLDGGEREDVASLIESFLKMHAEFFNNEGTINETGLVKRLEDAINDRAVAAKFLDRLAFINLSALFVAQKRERNHENILSSIIAQYTLLLRLLSSELQSVPPSTDPTAYITPIVRRTASSLRLYSKWLVLHYHLVPADFWTQYATTATSLLSIWPKQTQPKLSYPLEEDLAAAGFAPLEVPANVADVHKRKHKRDRARIGNRKKGFDKLLLQWGRSGGDSVTSGGIKDQGPEHPNVEMTLRLADLVSDAVEIASIPASGVQLIKGKFIVSGKERIEEGAVQLVSTGVPVEALGRMSLDEADAGERSFSEPQESSEEELGMAFSPGKMVDDIVGDDEKEGPNDSEEIMFSGRATRKQFRSSQMANTKLPSPITLPPAHLNTPSPVASPITAPHPPKTAADLVSRVLAFSNRSSSPNPTPQSLSPVLPTNATPQFLPEDHEPYPAMQPSPRLSLHPFDDARRRDESPVGVIGQGRASPRRTERQRQGNESPRWGSGFTGL